MAKENFELFVVDQFDDDESLPTFKLPAEELEVSEGYNYSLRWKDAT